MPQETRQRKGISPRAVLLSAVESATVSSGQDELIADIWNHADVVSRIARALAPRADVDPYDAAAAGLLHDVGELLLLERRPGEYPEVRSAPWAHSQQLRIEKVEFRVDHALLGAQHLLDLRIPDVIADAVADHHDPFRDSQPTTLVVAAADEIVDPDPDRRHALDLLGVSAEAATTILRAAVGDLLPGTEQDATEV